MGIEHDFFGVLSAEPDGSIYWSETIEIGDQAVTVDLTAPDQNDVTQGALDRAAALVAGIEDLDDSVRRAMLAEVDDRTSEVTEFILRTQETHGEELEELLVDVSGDVAVDVIRSLCLMSMTILVDEHGGDDPFAVLEYGLDTGDVEDVVLVNLDSEGAVLSVMSAD